MFLRVVKPDITWLAMTFDSNLRRSATLLTPYYSRWWSVKIGGKLRTIFTLQFDSL